MEQWRNELHGKFGLAFDVLTRDHVETSHSANPFSENDPLIARLDTLSRNPDRRNSPCGDVMGETQAVR